MEDEEDEDREPERVCWRRERKWVESLSGVRGNCAGRINGVPNTASAGERLVAS